MKLQPRLIVLLAVSELCAGRFAAAAERVDYLRAVKPVLAERCYACHGALKQEGGLRLDTVALARKGGDSGAAIVPGDPSSPLLERVTSNDESIRMPQEGLPLKPEQIAALRSWIEQNAEAPVDERPEQDPRDHWAFRPIVRPPVPQVTNSKWERNPIDAFIAQRHEHLELTPKPEAPREVLLRRLYLDLIGLPPSEGELWQIDAKNEDDVYERLVHHLLDDPRHGERWARHWMDIWRYSDWWGLNGQLRYSQRHIWHWRDWIVESLNANLPYDEMIRSMLAADELYPNDLNKLAATGLLARNYYVYGRNPWMEETIEHVCKGLLGLTMNCAKCHDHKYDPIKQVDYYRMRAIFEPYHVRVDVVPGQSDLLQDGVPRVFEGLIDKPTYLFERGQESQPDKSKVIAPGVPEALSLGEFVVKRVSLPIDAWQPERRPWVLEAYLKTAKDKVAAAEATTDSVIAKLPVVRKQFRDVAKVATGEKPPAPSSNAAHAEAKANVTAAEAAIIDAKAELHAATLAAELARLELASIGKRARAIRASWAKADGAQDDAALAKAVHSTRIEAIKAERRGAVAKSAHAVADVELRLLRAPTDAKPPLQTELSTAREGLSKAEQLAAAEVNEADQYAPLTGATWTPTNHIVVQKTDPEVTFAAQSTGRRSALAAWITDRRNPLTARVAVNHIWARHMGTPLVATVFDFGRKGSPPTHPELLDWLAAELIDSGWDMKHLHRLIVESSTYRMSSSAADSDSNLAKDPDNRHLWRRSPMRLESQVVRDSILSIAGTLDLTPGGPPVPPENQAESTRRSLYFFHSNNDRNMFLATFDEATVNECYRRDQSIIPQQALALSNSGLVHDAAGRIAERVSQLSGKDAPQISQAQFVEKAFGLILGIRPTEAEISRSVRALEQWRELPDEPADPTGNLARQHFVWALLNHTDFITVR